VLRVVTPPEEGGAIRQRVLDATGRLVERFTYAKMTMEDVARASGVARQTLYKHFAGKDDLLVELFIREMEEQQHPALDPYRQEPPSAQAFLDLIVAELTMARSFGIFREASEPRIAELLFASDKLFRCREAFWFPVLACYETAGLLRPGLDHAAIVRWITYQELWLLSHPEVLSTDLGEQRRYLDEFVIAALTTGDRP